MIFSLIHTVTRTKKGGFDEIAHYNDTKWQPEVVQ